LLRMRRRYRASARPIRATRLMAVTPAAIGISSLASSSELDGWVSGVAGLSDSTVGLGEDVGEDVGGSLTSTWTYSGCPDGTPSRLADNRAS